jgi:MFS family permease
MTDTVFGVVTSSFTLGGFVGSSAASPLLDHYGRRGVLIMNAVVVALGSAIFSLSITVQGLIAGRYQPDPSTFNPTF